MGQTYIPFPEDSAQWCIYYSEGHPNYGLEHEGYYSYDFSGDTMINGKSFKNISVSRNWYHYYTFGGGENWLNADIDLGLCGAIREEDKKVYFYRYISTSYLIPASYNIPDTTETLLYDFNLGFGDTANIIELIDHPYIVYLVDSVLCEDGIYHRTIWLQNDVYQSTTWVEGIGDIINGLFGTFIFEFEGFEWSFQGFSKDSVDIYGSASCYEGGFDAISDLQENNFMFYFENENTLVIKCDSYIGNYCVEIFDVSGAKVYNSIFSDIESKIDLGSIVSGLYFVKLSSDNKILKTEKIYKK